MPRSSTTVRPSTEASGVNQRLLSVSDRTSTEDLSAVSCISHTTLRDVPEGKDDAVATPRVTARLTLPKGTATGGIPSLDCGGRSTVSGGGTDEGRGEDRAYPSSKAFGTTTTSPQLNPLAVKSAGDVMACRSTFCRYKK